MKVEVGRKRNQKNEGTEIKQEKDRSWLPTAPARGRVRAEYVGFVVDKAEMGQVFSATMTVITRGWHTRPTGGRSAEWTQLDFTPDYTRNNLKKQEKIKKT
jgi:hypothetical protein